MNVRELCLPLVLWSTLGNKTEKLFYFNFGAGTFFPGNRVMAENVPRLGGLCYQLWESRGAVAALLSEGTNSSRRGHRACLLQTQSWPVCSDCQPRIPCGLWVVWVSPGRPGSWWQNSQGQAGLSSVLPGRKGFGLCQDAICLL